VIQEKKEKGKKEEKEKNRRIEWGGLTAEREIHLYRGITPPVQILTFVPCRTSCCM
jgi:hypothetical protein